MATKEKNLSQYDTTEIPDASEFTIGVVVADWNKEITHALLDGCRATLLEHGLPTDQLHVIHVPGSFELTAGARMLAGRYNCDAIICLGCVIKGETSHNEYINMAVANGLTNLSLASGKPFIFGVLTPNNKEQALDRAGGKHGNKGIEAAITALQMVGLREELKQTGKQKIGFGS